MQDRGLLAGLRVHDAGRSVVTAQALRVLGCFGATTTSANPRAHLLADGQPVRRGDGHDADVVLTEEGGRPPTAPVEVWLTGLDIDAPSNDQERWLQVEFGLAAMTGEADGPPLLTAGWPALLHCGAQMAAAALLGAIATLRRGQRTRCRVDARTATLWMLDDTLLRSARGCPPPLRSRGTGRLESDGRLLRARDGWVALPIWDVHDWATLVAVADAAGTGPHGASAGARGDASGRPPATDGPLGRVGAEGSLPSGWERAAIARWAAARCRADILATLADLRLPGAPGWTPEELLTDVPVRPWRLAGRPRSGIAGASPVVVDLGPPAPGGGSTRPRLSETGPGALPLDGVVVVELAALWAGPAATCLLVDWGATVLKIESPHRLDGFRGAGGTRFATFNRGKRAVACDLATASDRARLATLLEGADLLLDCHAPRVLANWGFDDATLRQRHPQLAVCHLPAVDVPPDHWPQPVALGPDLEMLCGQAVLDPGDAPRLCGVPLGDVVAAAWGTCLCLAALWRRDRDGRVAHCRLGQREAFLAHTGPRLEAARHGRRWPGDALAGRTAEGARHPEDLLADSLLAEIGATVTVVDLDGSRVLASRPPIDIVGERPRHDLVVPPPGEFPLS